MINLLILIAALLLIASVFSAVQMNTKVTPERVQNRQRIYSWCLIFLLCSFVFYVASLVGSTVILLFLMAILSWIIYELFSLFKILLSPIKLFGIYLIVLCCCLLLIRLQGLSQLSFVLTIVFALLVFLSPIKSSVYLPLMTSYCFLSLFSLYLISVLAERNSLDFAAILVVLFFITAVNDIAQYIFGSLFGKMKIAPFLSPKKTLFGLGGGIITSALLSILCFPMVLNITFFEAFIIGMMISLFGFFGDLIVSKLKRELGVKDAGKSIAGHGGILDRVDSLLLITPVFGMMILLGGYL